MKRLVIARYDPTWPLVYERERAAILGAIGERLIEIEHIGSTSVQGLAAKPIVDILAGLSTLAGAGACVQPLAELGYHFVPEAMADLPDDRYFERWSERYERGTEIAHLHLTEHGGSFWRDHLLFRDRLREHPRTAAAYEKLKRQLVARRALGVAYSMGKTAFVTAVLAQE
jgi:GrpB-like predicted nucleotidyltransferase (UPF0157 family)